MTPIGKDNPEVLDRVREAMKQPGSTRVDVLLQLASTVPQRVTLSITVSFTFPS